MLQGSEGALGALSVLPKKPSPLSHHQLRKDTEAREGTQLPQAPLHSNAGGLSPQDSSLPALSPSEDPSSCHTL